MSYIRNNKTLLLIIAVLLVTNLSLLYLKVWNKGGGGPDKGPRGFMAAMLQKDVLFTNEQIAQYEELRTSHFKNMKPLFDEVGKAKDSLYQLMNREEAPDSLINHYAEIVSQKQKMVEVKMFQYLKTIEALCTPEQRPKFDSVVQRLIKRQPGRRGGDDKNKKK